ncbi:coproporphyrinogen oxidase [Sphingobacterium allocomposti]|jgi:coproporphyrinogen III oxidase|uniref:coproporphyrinogen oxidase n=1 Tax=Sphingobacterium allocomposti TaxID=415956 RepID=A0A5S5DID9_9SPHI|nr:oxygen-dependent coproporphyrinogen oxidase [Sphingobacterium composti Yoo et al. 2007 non Ten et al. 2007]TYP95753.1 coproporphyrinogen oxidase [Sphingobacterium composti Yoo et al. 2007 non Ten et al. 2007]
MSLTKEFIAETYQSIQDEITGGLEDLDGKATFQEELWERDGGGGGRTRIIQNGDILEKGGVNFSAVHGKLPEAIKKAFAVDEDDFFATGVSIVIHPNNPWVPIIHMNIRYFELNEQLRWFGGGIDLTPHYVVEEDAKFFHQMMKNVCDKHHPSFYNDFKTWADNYFYIKHRQETRGIGGVFYDKLTPEKTGLTEEQLFSFSCDLGRSFLPTYTELVNRSRHKKFTQQQKEWQLLRRGRYVEFNLVYDSGTRFGLETNGRIESILMSLPAQANWAYDFKAEPGSLEEKTLLLLKKDVSWAL